MRSAIVRTMSDDPASIYRGRLAGADLEVGRLARIIGRVVHLRLLSFLLAVACGGVGLWRGWWLLAVPAGIAVLAFVMLVRWHGALARRHRRALVHRQINDEALARLARDWERLPAPGGQLAPVPDDHPYAADLDITGGASLLHLLDTTTTPMGAAALAAWLLAPAETAVVRGRQDAAAELAPLLDLREELQVLGRLHSGDGEDPEPFLSWAEQGGLPRRWALLLAWARVGPPLAAVLALLFVTHVVPVPLWVPVLVANGLVGLWLAPSTEATLARVRANHGALAVYAGQLTLLSGASPRSSRLRRLQEMATADGLPAPRLLRRLDGILSFAVPPAAAHYLPFQLVLLWNVHAMAAVERWRVLAGHRARGWLDALGELEALAALGGLAHAHPAWAWPELSAQADRVEAVGLGHPLLAPASRVDNDVTMGPPGSVLLVTGSNMSGKSTLLRALGTNAVLAAAGGPACATSLRLPPLRVWTSMRIADSLERGVSYFLAELRRMKRIVEAAQEATDDTGLVCYLLDEVLQGTNTAERQVAVRAIVVHLAACHAVGAVSTHDLTLADDPAMARLVRHVHFRETITSTDGRPSMTFDHRLRPGLATSTNALLLMELIGLSL
jgi:hypothetical protein